MESLKWRMQMFQKAHIEVSCPLQSAVWKKHTGLFQHSQPLLRAPFRSDRMHACDSPTAVVCNVQGGPAKVRPTYIFDGNI